MFRGWKNVVEKLVKGPRDFQRGGGVGDGRQRKGTEGYRYLPQNALLLNTQQQSGARQDMYIVRKNPPKTPALSERKPKGAVASLVPLRLRRSESAFFRTIYNYVQSPGR